MNATAGIPGVLIVTSFRNLTHPRQNEPVCRTALSNTYLSAVPLRYFNSEKGEGSLLTTAGEDEGGIRSECSERDGGLGGLRMELLINTKLSTRKLDSVTFSSTSPGRICVKAGVSLRILCSGVLVWFGLVWFGCVRRDKCKKNKFRCLLISVYSLHIRSLN